MPYGDFLRTRIFDPLGMESTGYHADAALVPLRSPGYSAGAEGWTLAEPISMTQAYAAGGMLSTVDDLARWEAAIERDALLFPDSGRLLRTPGVLADGSGTRYAAGWELGRIGVLETMEHAGGMPGGMSYVLRVPERRLYVAVLTNADSGVASPDGVALRLATAALGVERIAPEVPLDPERLDEYAGTYLHGEDDLRRVRREGERLYSQRG